jgi:peptidoglycan/xylan/chitin deacetylase (PgdA/CDA1 family)
MFYLSKTPRWLRPLHSDAWWKLPGEGNKLYLSFDDGPHPVITPFVLDALDKVGAKASFFCIGNNVTRYPEVYKDIIARGHRVGNHTYDHLNGWKTADAIYAENVVRAGELIQSNLFRPPYGRLKKSQKKLLNLQKKPLQLVMWDVLSGDFDTRLDARKCQEFVLKGVEPGSIVVFHDSEKAFPRLGKMLVQTLERLADKGFQMKSLP